MTLAKTAPQLQSTRIHLVPFKPDMITELYVAWLNDKTLMRFSEQRHKTHNVDSCHDYLKTMLEQGHYFWAILEASTQNHIGNLTAYLDRYNLTANLAILIGDQKKHGFGLGFEAWSLVLEHLLNSGCRKVNAGTMAKNIGMCKIFKKSGMLIEGIRKHEYLLEGQAIDQILVTKFQR